MEDGQKIKKIESSVKVCHSFYSVEWKLLKVLSDISSAGMPVRVFITIFNILTMNTIGCEYQIDVTLQTSLHISSSQCSKISK